MPISKAEVLARRPRKISIDLSSAAPITKEELVQRIEDSGDIYIKKIGQQTQILLIDDASAKSLRVKQVESMGGILTMNFQEYLDLD